MPTSLRSVTAYTLAAAGFFFFGYYLGGRPTHPYTCPEILGNTPFQTIDSKDGQICIYLPTKTVGQVALRVKLQGAYHGY